MNMRQLAPLCFICLLACTTAAPPNKPSAPAASVEPPEPEVNVEALLARDGLLVADPKRPNEAKVLIDARRVELSGAPPRELLLHTRAGGVDTFWVYDVRDVDSPRQVAIPAAITAAMAEKIEVLRGLQWDFSLACEAQDLDRDGKAELILIGPGTTTKFAPLAVLGWGGSEGLVDKLWRDPGAAHILFVDVDGDGRREIVAFKGFVTGDSPLELVVVRSDEQGMWRPVTGDLKVWLPRVLDAMVGERYAHIDHGLKLVLFIMRRDKIAPRDVPALQAQLMGALKEGCAKEDPSALYDAMAWEGNLAAYDVMLPMLLPQVSPKPVVDALLELDARNGQTRGRDALIAWLKATLPRVRPADISGISEVLRGLSQRGDGAGAALAAAAMADEGLSLETREQLVRASLPYMSSQQEALWGLSQALRPALLEALIELMAHRTIDARWRGALDVAWVKALMADPATRVVGMRLAVYRVAQLREDVFAWFETLADAKTRLGLLRDANRMDVAPPQLAQLTRWLARATGEERVALLEWVMQSEDTALILKLLEQEQRDAQVLMLARRAAEIPLCWDTRTDSPVCRLGALRDELPALHKLVAARVRSGDAKVRAAALAVMAWMPDEPTQRLLIEIARTHKDAAMREAARASLIYAKSPFARSYFWEEQARDPSDYGLKAALGEVIDEADAQRLVDGLGDPATLNASLRLLATGASRVCAPRLDGLEALMADPATECNERARSAYVLGLCSSDWPLKLARDDGPARCEGRELKSVLSALSLHGTAAHIPVLEALSEDPRSRALREEAAGILERLRRRLAR